MGLFDKLTGKVTDFIDDVLLPDDLRTTLLRAQKASRDGEHEESLRLLDVLDERRPGLTRSLELRGQALIAMGKPMEAAEALRKAASQRPEASLLHQLGLALEEAGELRTARDALLQTLQNNPDNTLRVEVHRALGRVHLAMGRPDRGARELRKALRLLDESDNPDEDLAPSPKTLQVALAGALIARGELGEARAALDEALPEGPDEGDEAALRVMGRLLMLERRGDEALPWLEALLALHPEDLALRFDTVRAALDAKDLDRARGHLTEALEDADEETRTRAQALMGRVLLAAGDPEGAMGHLGRALESQPEDPEVQGAAAQAALAMASATDLDEDKAALVARAESGFARQRVLTPTSPEPLHGLGRCAVMREDWAGARRLLAQAMEMGGGASVRLDLARCCLQTQDPASAVAVLTESRGPDETLSAEAEGLLAQAYNMLAPALELPPGECRDLPALAAAMRRMRDWIAATPALIGFLPDIQQALRALDTPLDIAILGEFNAGKSTLVNAILGEAIVPTGVLPTTAHINVLRFGPRRAAQIHTRDGAIEEVPYGAVKKRVKADDGPRTIDHIEYLYPHPDLRRVHFWDTPGFNAIDPDHERHAQDALERAEAIFWLLDAGQALAESERVLIDTVHHGAERLVVILNKIDRLGDGDERAEGAQILHDRIREHLGEGVSGVFPMSALEGLKARQAEDEAALEASGLGALLDYASGEVYERVALLKAIEADRALSALRVSIKAHVDARSGALSSLQTQLDGVREGLEAEASNFATGFVAEERLRLQEGLEALLSVVSREIEESLQPAPGLFGALLTRTSLAEEDVEFILALLVERFDALLDRSHRRTQQALLDIEGRLVSGVERFSQSLPPSGAGLLRRRLDGHLIQSRTLRSLLTERVYGRYRAIARGRATAADAAGAVKRTARRDATGLEHKAALRQLLPDINDEMVGALRNWAEEYFADAQKFCDTTGTDLQVMSIELQALTTGLDTSPE